jgi:hypothetical protein
MLSRIWVDSWARIGAAGAWMIGVSKEARTLKTYRHPLPLESRAVLKAGL